MLFYELVRVMFWLFDLLNLVFKVVLLWVRFKCMLIFILDWLVVMVVFIEFRWYLLVDSVDFNCDIIWLYWVFWKSLIKVLNFKGLGFNIVC